LLSVVVAGAEDEQPLKIVEMLTAPTINNVSVQSMIAFFIDSFSWQL
jgi:hypothetical protein